MDDLAINFVPTGAIPTQRMNPDVPVSIPEIVESVLAANELGITIAHIHARDAAGGSSLDSELYGEIIAGIRRHAPDLVICVSLSGRFSPEFAPRSQPLELSGSNKPDMASLTLSSLNFATGASVNTPEVIMQLARKMQEKRILPELEIFDLGMANYATFLIQKGAVSLPCYANVILGNAASAQMDLHDISAIVQKLPRESLHALGGIGKAQLPANALSIATGAGVRVGLEDNLFLQKGVPATNMKLLERVHELAAIHGRKVMTPEVFRRLMKLQPGGGQYGTL
jgi:uncharacterized protein (DUF849 family)